MPRCVTANTCTRSLPTFRFLNVTWGGADPGQAQHAVVEVPVGEDVGQAVVVVVLLRVELQELLHADVGEAERVGAVLLVGGGVDLQQQAEDEDGDRQLLVRAATNDYFNSRIVTDYYNN